MLLGQSKCLCVTGNVWRERARQPARNRSLVDQSDSAQSALIPGLRGALWSLKVAGTRLSCFTRTHGRYGRCRASKHPVTVTAHREVLAHCRQNTILDHHGDHGCQHSWPACQLHAHSLQQQRTLLGGTMQQTQQLCGRQPAAGSAAWRPQASSSAGRWASPRPRVALTFACPRPLAMH